MPPPNQCPREKVQGILCPCAGRNAMSARRRVYWSDHPPQGNNRLWKKEQKTAEATQQSKRKEERPARSPRGRKHPGIEKGSKLLCLGSWGIARWGHLAGQNMGMPGRVLCWEGVGRRLRTLGFSCAANKNMLTPTHSSLLCLICLCVSRTRQWINLEPCGMFCGMITWLLIVYGMYATSVRTRSLLSSWPPT